MFLEKEQTDYNMPSNSGTTGTSCPASINTSSDLPGKH